MRIGQVFRYSRPYKAEPATIDGLPNYFAATSTAGKPLPLLDAGINPIASLDAADGVRQPAILIASSPHKTGYLETPWHDSFDPDNGFVLYYGDNKSIKTAPGDAPGNALLLKQFELHNSPDATKRAQASPLVMWERVTHDGRRKGQVAFMGLGVLARGELVTQYHPKTNEYFTNYRWELTILSLQHENEEFCWDWIAARRDPSLSLTDTLKYAPQAWRRWQKKGPAVLESSRRRVTRFPVTPEREQIPESGSPKEDILKRVYERYALKKCSFENLACFVSARSLRRNHIDFTEGWITPASGDGGVDFVGRVDLGIGFGRCRLVVLGQAKCEQLHLPTGGVHVARTVARLRRGWIGCYVTTSFFSDRVQREIADDEFPLLLINGNELATQLRLLVVEEGFGTLAELLEFVDLQYPSMLRRADPDAILRDDFAAVR